jgi:hypothetical protein
MKNKCVNIFDREKINKNMIILFIIIHLLDSYKNIE